MDVEKAKGVACISRKRMKKGRKMEASKKLRKENFSRKRRGKSYNHLHFLTFSGSASSYRFHWSLTRYRANQISLNKNGIVK